MPLKPLEIKVRLLKMKNERGGIGVSVAEASRIISANLSKKYRRQINIPREVLSKVIHNHPNARYPLVREGLADFLGVRQSQTDQEATHRSAELTA
jgi:hypothetical protein